MNHATIVKAEPTHAGLKIRVWVDDERGEHLTVAEGFIPATHLARYWVEVREEQDRHQQDPLPFDV